NRQLAAAHKIVARGMTVRAAEKLVKDLQESKPKPASPTVRDPDVLRLQDDISNRLGARVHIRHGKNGKGQMVINYTSLEELEGVLQKIR
ncbi:MAG: chromosome partitioning protein ParB, partial [Pseudomonadota bacterium]